MCVCAVRACVRVCVCVCVCSVYCIVTHVHSNVLLYVGFAYKDWMCQFSTFFIF